MGAKMFMQCLVQVFKWGTGLLLNFSCIIVSVLGQATAWMVFKVLPNAQCLLNALGTKVNTLSVVAYPNARTPNHVFKML